ncbi:MAG: vWA domain-containing protein [Patescibacteria group bacterium]
MKEVRFDRAATPKGPPTPPVKFTEPEIEFSARELEQIMDPAYLELISGASGFSYQIIDEPPPNVPQHVLGFTDMRRKRIFLVRQNAARLLLELKASGTPEKGAQKLRGFLVHEGGHHAPEVLALDQKLRVILGKSELEPNALQEYFNDPADRKPDDPQDKGETRALFWKAFWYDNCNGSLDVWLESFQARGQFDYSLGEDLFTLHELSVTGRDFLRGMPLHHQLTQVLVGEEVYLKGRGKKKVREQRVQELDQFAHENLDPEVAKALTRLRKDGVMGAMGDRTSFEYWGANSPQQKERCINKKFQAVVEHIYPAWRKLLLLEFERRKEAFRQMAKEAKRTFTDPELKQIYHKILKELLDKTQEMGKDAYASETPGEGDPQKMEEIFKKIQASSRGKEPNAPPPPPSALDKAKAAISRGLEDVDAKKIVDLADRFGVSEASLRKLQDIERKYAGEIERLATDIADSFLNQRRARIRYQMLEGMTTPGMEGIEYAEAQRGNLDVRTHQITEQAAEFLQTEVEHLFDTSGSMSAHNRLEYAQIVSVILTRAFEKVKAILEGEGLLRPQEEDPLRSGYVLFTTAPERIKKLDEPSKPGTLAQMIEQTGKHSGGTDDAAAIKALETQFKLREPNVLKFMIIYSDGEGNAGAVQNIMEAIEKDKSIIVVIVAMGANPGNVATTYETTVRSKGGQNIKIVQGDDVKANLPELTNFFKKVIREASERLS